MRRPPGQTAVARTLKSRPCKGVGERVEFGGLLGYAPIMPVKTGSCADFIARGGRIPAPVQSMKN